MKRSIQIFVVSMMMICTSGVLLAQAPPVLGSARPWWFWRCTGWPRMPGRWSLVNRLPVPPQVAIPRPTAAERDANQRCVKNVCRYQQFPRQTAACEVSIAADASGAAAQHRRHVHADAAADGPRDTKDLSRSPRKEMLISCSTGIPSPTSGVHLQPPKILAGVRQVFWKLQERQLRDLRVTRHKDCLWGLQNGEGQGFQPKAIMLMIGTNNTGGNTAPEIAEGVGAVVLEMRKDFPSAKILLLAIFPRSVPGDPVRDKINEINKIIAKLDDQQHVFYMDIGAKFLDDKGVFLPDTFRTDNLHPVAKGYEIWGTAVKDKLAELMK